jgi:hypothetical protein
VLEELPARDREVLTRLFVQEQSPDQICAEMSLNKTQLRMITGRAKAQFAASLKQARETAGAPVDLREAEHTHFHARLRCSPLSGVVETHRPEDVEMSSRMTTEFI